MKKNVLVFALGLMLSSFTIAPSALAQDFGFLAGVHQTSADSDSTGVSIDGKFNFKLGLATTFALTDTTKFRTGILYNQRHIESTAAGTSTDINFDYLDIPALVQFNVNEMFGLFGGLVVAINVNDDVDYPTTLTPKPDPDAEGLIPLLSLGVNMTFQDMIGFDLYYERGLGDFAKNLENYGTFGANFIYWF